jgi:ribosomal protein L12E/L44/L45/RPP1/RPP2
LRRTQLYHSQHLHSYFDSISGADDELDEEGLYRALEQAGVQMSKEQVRTLMKSADKDGNMKLSKEEWVDVARAANGSSSKLSSPAS